jgi:uncharacterized protein YndB with AHSA1/START domain
MTDIKAVKHATFTIERIYSASVAKVFKAFADPEVKRRWFVEGPGWTTGTYTLDFRVGGREHSEGGSPQGGTYGNDTLYQDIIENRRIIFAYTMYANGQRISASLATVELEAVDAGAKLFFTEQAAFLEGADGPHMRKAGWTWLFARLDSELTGAPVPAMPTAH